MKQKPEEISDKALVEGCLRNDRISQELLYRRFFPTMYRMIRRYTQDEEIIMEILNTGFLRVFTKLDTFSFAGSLEGWIRRLVFHSLSDHFRKYKKESGVKVDLEDRDSPVEAAAISGLFFEDIIQLVDRLPGATREVFWLYAVEGYNHAEIGERLGISDGTSKWHLSMARQKLRKMIEKYYHNTNYHAG
ncbi:MAG: sigma-70 family RNA polymerase sigma factor [Lewinellaceae bacterium]|nr:sigma-70 family RNA polymerase sigma factor [Lewinella sp.]MCB9280886.1 sigma-70 family RNA polymerase sigma factor [Lewinellaceae bacterium]HMQ90667.1 sigma-70 family RNA polymerase sigma factor [Flavilitoribacter sp.]